MLPISKDEFLELLRRNSILSNKYLDRLASELDSYDSTKQLVLELVQQNLITAWQAKQLLSGTQNLGLGRYQFVDSLGGDEFGETFLAVHKDLNRNVILQVLPDEIRDRVFEDSKKKLSQIASLDHANLVHCLDIDQVDGKLVVITEHLKGVAISEANLDELNEFDVAKIVSQCLAGLKFAHERGVFHGELDPSNIVINMGNLKIRDLALANLKRLVDSGSETQLDFQADLFDLAEIGLDLLDRIPGNDSGIRMDLLTIISELETGSGNVAQRVADRLDRWIESNRGHEKSTPASGSRETTNAATRPAISLAVPDNFAFSMRGAKPRSKYRPKRKRVSLLMVYGLIVGGFAVLCLGLLVYWNYSDSERKKAQAQETSDAVSALEKSESKVVESAVSDEPGKTTSRDIPFPDRPTIETSDVIAEARNPASESAGDKPVTDDLLPTEKIPLDEGVANAPKISQWPAANLPASTRPFQGFTPHVKLPPIENVKEIKIGDLTINPQFLLGLKLFATPEATRKSGLFELRRSETDKQRWIVSKRKSEKSQRADIATFWKTPTEFRFQWLPDARLDEDANYLRNGALKLEIPDGQSCWLSLRSPITIDGFKLDQDESSVKLKIELPWLPNPKGLVFEIASFPDQDIPSLCAPEFVQPKSPALMYFTREEAKAFVWLEVTADRRSTIVLDAELKINAMGNVQASTLR